MNAVFAGGMLALAAAVRLAACARRRRRPPPRRLVLSPRSVSPAPRTGRERASALGGWLGFGPAALVSDRLAGVFLLLAGATGAAAARAAHRPPARPTASLHA